MATSRIQKYSHYQHTFLTQRFDRKIDDSHIHFASAITLLGYTDGMDYQDGVSYLIQNGANVAHDLEML